MLSNHRLLSAVILIAVAGMTGPAESSDIDSATAHEKLDIARFARVVTWDPSQTSSTKSSRIEEIPVQDLFMDSEILPDSAGNYIVPVKDGVGCIGLQWDTGRLLTELSVQLAEGCKYDSIEAVNVQYWSTKGIQWAMHKAGSVWQGSWQPLKGRLERQQDRLVFRMGEHGSGLPLEHSEGERGIQKIRWLFPASTSPIVLQNVSAFTESQWKPIELFIQLEKPLDGKRGEIEVWNGEIITPKGSSSSLRSTWDLSKPTRLKLRYCWPSGSKLDRTVLRLRLPSGSFGVAVDDVLANECVYVRDFGVFVARYPVNMTLAEYKKKIAGKKTVLQRVREMPDQTFSQAWEKVHRPIQDNGPMMLSLACDNNKFIVHRQGLICFDTVPETVGETFLVKDWKKYPCQLKPEMGAGRIEGLKRHREGGWLPVTVTELQSDGVTYRQRTYVAPYGDESLSRGTSWMKQRSVCVAEFTIENRQAQDANVSLKLRFTANNLPAEVLQAEWGAIAQASGRILGCIETTRAESLQIEMKEPSPMLGETDGIVHVQGTMPANGSATCTVYLPAWDLKSEETASLVARTDLRSRVDEYWNQVMAEAMQLQIPELLLLNIIRAAQVDCLTAARNAEDGAHVLAFCAGFYGPMESESQPVIYGMDLMGHHEFARRSHDYFISRYNPSGFLTTGYTIMGTGWHLLTLARHYNLMPDSDWLRNVAPVTSRACQWVTDQRSQTKRLDARGERMPEYGLMPPGVIADWNTYTYRFFLNGLFCVGLHEMSLALKSIDYPGATEFIEDAIDFRKEILRAYHWTQSRTPVLQLSDGSWVPGYPTTLHAPGEAADFWPDEDWGRIDYHDIECGANHLSGLGVLDPDSPDTIWMIEHMEDVEFLKDGCYEYPAELVRKDWFSLGGFARCQPYYTRYVDLCAVRDDVKPFIRSYFNTIPTLVGLEHLHFWEHFHNNGAWNKTAETGGFLQQTRLMYVMERGDELWLAPFVTNNWLKDGEVVSVQNAPTRFGRVSYKITSHVQNSYIDCVIEPPARNTPDVIVIRLRHPEGKRIRVVKVNNEEHTEYDPVRELIHVKSKAQSISVRVEY